MVEICKQGILKRLFQEALLTRNRLNKMENISIIGAGIAGLTAGYYLGRHGFQVDIAELDKGVGGLAKSFYYKDFVFDIGPHRFFAEDRETFDFIKGILRGDYATILRSSGVYFCGRYCGWPLQPKIVFKLPPSLTVRVLSDLVRRSKRSGDSFEDYILNRYGKTLYNSFFKDYTEKFLKQHPATIHLDWATAGIERAIIDQRTEFTNLPTLIWKSLLPLPVKTEFIYPTRGGIGIFALRLAEEIEGRRGMSRLGTRGAFIGLKNDRIEEIILTDGSRHRPDILIWTAPIDVLCNLIGIGGTQLKYLSMVLFNLEIESESVLPYQWCYYGQKDIIFNRVSVPKNFYHQTAPPGKTGVSVEVTCLEGDKVWKEPAGVLEAVKADMMKVGLISSPRDIRAVHVERVANVYPIYELNYSQRLQRVVGELRKFANLRLLGRSGTFWYNNMDHSIAAAREMAREVTRQKRENG